MKILIVEDENDSRIFLERRLQKEGYIVFSAVNGVEALESARETKPDIVISDLMMPEMDGFELCRRLKADEHLRTIPFLFYTATYIDRKDEQLAMDLGGERFIVKPIEIEWLLEIIREVLEEHKEQTLPSPDKPAKREEELTLRYAESIARKLDKKVKELEEERQALQQSEQKYRRLVEGLKDDYFFYSLNEKGVFTYLSPSITNVLGYSPEDFLTHYTEYLTENPLNKEARRRSELSIKGEKQPPYELEIYHKDGSVRSLGVKETPVFDNHGEVVAVEGIAHDITEQKKAIEAMQESEKKYRQLVESTNDWVWSCDINGIHIFSNKAIKSFLGYEPHEIIGKYAFDFMHPEDIKWAQKMVQQAVNQKKGWQQDTIRWLHKDGSVKYLESRAEPVLDAEGNIAGFSGIDRDVTDRKQAEDALRENEARLRSLSNNLPSGMTYQLDMGKDGQERQFTYVSAGVEKMHEVTAEAVLQDAGLLYGQIIEADWPLITEREAQAQATMTPFVAEARFRLPSGAVRWRLLTSAPRRASNGHLIWDGIEIDITERKQAEQRLQASEERYRGLVNTMQDIVHLISADGTILFIGPQVERYGFTEEELVSQPFSDFIHPEDLDTVLSDFQHTLSTAEQMFTTFRIIAKDGSVVWFEETGQVVRDTTGNIVGISGILRDVTEKKQAEEALRDSERKLHAIFDHHYQLTGLVDTEGRLLAANRTALRFAGAEESEVIGHYFWDGPWWDSSQRSELRNAVERAVRGEFIRFETTHPTADGQIRNIDFSLSPVRNDDGNVIYVVPEGRDITEIKRAEQEKVKLQEQLNKAQKMEAIGTLAGGIAHDFNNILSVIIGYTEIALEDELPEKTPAKSSLQKVLSAGFRAKDLVKQILTFSRQSEFEKQPVSLNAIVKETTNLLRAAIPSNIEIRKNILDKEGMIFADPTQLHQIIMNICTNATYAMREKGGVLDLYLSEVSLGMEASRELSIFKPGVYFKLAITDTGHGMDQLTKEQIFDPFFTTKPKEEGTGLGLSVVHGIIKEHGGHITVESEIGQGSVFSIYLPKMVTPDPMEIEEPTSIQTGTEKILVVDDEQGVVDSMVKMLQKLGYQVTGMTSSKKALDTFQSHPEAFDLIITDQTMPEMTGDVLAQEIISISPEIPIILCTGFSYQITKEYIEALGIKELVMKPVLRNQLAESVRRALDSSGVK